MEPERPKAPTPAQSTLASLASATGLLWIGAARLSSTGRDLNWGYMVVGFAIIGLSFFWLACMFRRGKKRK